MKRQPKGRRLLPPVSLFLLVSALGVVYVSQLNTQGQTNESVAILTADSLESITCKPIDDSRKRISVVIEANKKTRDKKVLPETITVGFNGEPVDFKSTGSGQYQAIGRLKGGEYLDTTETLDLAHGFVRTGHPKRGNAEMSLRCNTRSVSCKQDCRSTKSHTPCIICFETCGIDWEK
jgi:hypothetical protein